MLTSDVKTFAIMRLYELYSEDKFKVNRRYQRKLVWSLKEKQELIISILKRYPIPSIFILENEDYYEIIDGTQRLNAIFSFIENEFPVNWNGKEVYFDVRYIASAQLNCENGIIKCKKIMMNY